MLSLNDLIYWGYVARTHGTKGEVLVKVEQDVLDEIDESKPVFLELEGKPVPFFPEAGSVRWKDNQGVYFKFEDIDIIEQAEALLGVKVHILAGEVDVETESPQNFVLEGYRFFDKDKLVGRIVFFHDIKNNPLLEIELEKGTDTVLIPYAEDWITEISSENSFIRMDLPRGLLDD